MRGLRLTIVGFAAALLLGVGAPRADKADADGADEAFRWLMNEPVTLLDLGMMRLRQDLTEASLRLHADGVVALRPEVGVYFDWRRQKIVSFLVVRETVEPPSRGRCLDVFGRVVGSLTAKAPAGSRQAGWYLESIFTHEGPGSYRRPMNMRRDLLSGVHLEVSLLPPDPMNDTRRLLCAGRLDSDLDKLAVTIS